MRRACCCCKKRPISFPSHGIISSRKITPVFLSSTACPPATLKFDIRAQFLPPHDFTCSFSSHALSLSHPFWRRDKKRTRHQKRQRERREIIIKQQQQKSVRGKLAKNACVRYLRLTCNLPWRVVLKSGCRSQKGMRMVLFLVISQRHSWKPASATHF